MSSFDVFGCYLEFWNASDFCGFADEDIRLIDTSENFAVGFFDESDSLERDVSIRHGESQESEVR